MVASVVRWIATSESTTTSANVNISGVAVGESMIVAMVIGSTTATITPPAGWDPTPLFAKTTMGSRACVAYVKTKTDVGETSAIFTSSVATGIATALIGVVGALPANWVVGPIWTRALHGTTLTNVADGVTPVTTNNISLVLSFEATSTVESPNTIVGVDNGFAELGYKAQNAIIETIWAGTKSTPTTTDVGDTTITYRNTQASNGAAIMIAFPEAPSTPVGLPIDLGNGTVGRITYMNSGGVRQTPASVRLLKPGFNNAAQFVATPGATMAHRGGSESFPDMSEYAYDQAILRGFGALEFSAQRSSDGWWFGLHNPDINEVAGTVGLPNASAMTRAEIEAYANVDNPIAGHPSRPFFGLIEFLEKYGSTHVLMVDPKNALSFNTEFMTICESIVPKSRLMWKYYIGGPGSTNPTNGAAAAMARGWSGTWGYCYSEDVDSGAFAEHSGNAAWTTLGINIGANQTYWDTVLAVGKPVIGHIANSQADYNTAISKGADMVQCADTTEILAVSI